MTRREERIKQIGSWRTSDNVSIAPDRFKFKRVSQDPLYAIIQRFGLAIMLVMAVTLITYVGRRGYYDAQDPDGLLTFIDALYYSTVTITTTGYGDIVPATQWARFITTVVVTPLRVVFLILLVGTTLEVLANQSRFLFRLRNWQKEMKDHIIICGYGIKGEAALEYLKNHEDGQPAVAVDSSNDALERANGEALTRGVVFANGFDCGTLDNKHDVVPLRGKWAGLLGVQLYNKLLIDVFRNFAS